MKKRIVFCFQVVLAAALTFGAFYTVALGYGLLTPGAGGGLLAPINLSGLVLTVANPLVVTGTAPTTLKGDGTASTIGGALNVSGTITQNGSAVLTTSSITIGGTNSSTFNLGSNLFISSSGTIGVTSTPIFLAASLFGSTLNASGTISQNGTPVLTTSTIFFGTVGSSTFNVGNALTMSSSGTLSFSNTPGYITTSSINFGSIASSTFNLGSNLFISSSGTIGVTSTPLFASSSLFGGTVNVSGTFSGSSSTFSGNVTSTGGLTVSSTGSGYSLSVTNPSGTVSFAVASSGIAYLYGTSTISFGNVSLAAGACTSTAMIIPMALSTSTDSFTQPTAQTYPGAGFQPYMWIDKTTIGGTTSSVTIEVCAAVIGTPTASKYNFNIFRMIGL